MDNITILPEDENNLLQSSGNHFINLKSSRIAPASLQKHFVAFANTDGGELYVGIEDEKVNGCFASRQQAQREVGAISRVITITSPDIRHRGIKVLSTWNDL